ncbi:Uncharacterised protein [uncultured archaeon]|nr:Uncharacterised protein [uncultured archaeon]
MITADVRNLLPIDAIMRGNATRKVIAPNKAFNEFFRSYGTYAKLLKEAGTAGIQDKIEIDRWNTGTAFAMPEKGNTFRKYIEKELQCGNRKKTFVFEVPKEYAGANDAIDTMILCNHGFAGGKPLLPILNAKTGKEIAELEEAEEILLQFRGKIQTFWIGTRVESQNFMKMEKNLFEPVWGGFTYMIAAKESAIGLLRRAKNDIIAGDELHVDGWTVLRDT